MSNDSDFSVGMLLFEGAEELDWAGPYEVFGMALKIRQAGRLVTIAESLEPVRCYNGLRVLPDHDFSNAPPSIWCWFRAGSAPANRSTTRR